MYVNITLDDILNKQCIQYNSLVINTDIDVLKILYPNRTFFWGTTTMTTSQEKELVKILFKSNVKFSITLYDLKYDRIGKYYINDEKIYDIAPPNHNAPNDPDNLTLLKLLMVI